MSVLTPPLPQTGLPLAPMPDKGAAPKHRLKNAFDAQTIVSNLWTAAQQRNLRNAAMQGMLDGNPPYSPTKLRAAGRSGDANFNTLEGKALLSAALVPYHDLCAGDRRKVDIRTDEGSEQEKSRWSGVISEEYDRMLGRWGNFDYQMQQMERDFVGFGKGFLMWESQKSWRFKKIAHYRVLVPDATDIDVDAAELIVVLQNWPQVALERMIADKKSAAALGWNTEATQRAISGAVPVDPAVPNDPISAQQQIKDNDIQVSARSSTVQTATIFVREFSGKWSELIVKRDVIPANDPQFKSKVQFLFEARDKYDQVTDILVPFFFEVMDGSWNGASGLARDIFSIMQLKDRIACQQAQSTFLRNSLVLQPRTAMDKTRMNLLQIGAVTWVPEGAEVLQSTILGDIESTIAVSRELTIMTEKNTGIYRPTIERTEKGNPVTLGEFQMRSAQASVLSTSAVNRFYSQLDRMYEAQWRRVLDLKDSNSDDPATKEAKLFFKRCYDRGVPETAWQKIESVRAWRNIGNGSAAMRQQTLSNYMGIYPLLPADGQVNLLEDIVSVSGSQAQVERYVRTNQQEGLPSDDMNTAMLENAALKIGAPVTWTPSQNNLIHATTHLQAAAQAGSSLEQGAPMPDVLAFIDAIGAHVAIHLQQESQKPTSKDAVKELEKQWKQLAGFADKLRARIEQDQQSQQELQQRTEQRMSELDLKMMELERKLEISQIKTQAGIEMKAQKQQFEMGLKQQRAIVETTLQDATTAADIARMTRKTQAEIETQKKKASSDPKAAEKT